MPLIQDEPILSQPVSCLAFLVVSTWMRGGCMLTRAALVQVRKLAAEVYGAHEQNGEWNDEGEWHVVGDEDLESSDDDLLGSDVESSSDDDDEDGDLDLVGDESSGDDFDSEEESEDEDGVPLGHMSSGQPCHFCLHAFHLLQHITAQHCSLLTIALEHPLAHLVSGFTYSLQQLIIWKRYPSAPACDSVQQIRSHLHMNVFSKVSPS